MLANRYPGDCGPEVTASAAVTVRTVLGDERPVSKVYADGSVNCPWCCAAIRKHELPHCPNPACYANASWRPEALRAHREEQDRKQAEMEAERAARVELNAWRMQYAEEQRAAREARLAEVIAAGFCARCFTLSGERKKVRHRKECKR